MRKWFFVTWMVFALTSFVFSCSPDESRKEAADRTSIKIKQWKADSLVAREQMNRMNPDTMQIQDSLALDSLQTDSLLR
jgi:hypothetical protein